MGINWLNYRETQRSNLAKEAETERSNLVKEAETMRSNLVKEAETHRANVRNEDIAESKYLTEAQTKREQIALDAEKLAETTRHNTVNERHDFINAVLRADGPADYVALALLAQKDPELLEIVKASATNTAKVGQGIAKVTKEYGPVIASGALVASTAGKMRQLERTQDAVNWLKSALFGGTSDVGNNRTLK